MLEHCPCLSGSPYERCCGALLNGNRQAASAVQLMRSRYTAFYVADVDYLLATLHPSRRESNAVLDIQETISEVKWLGLKVIDSQSFNSHASVTFAAFYQAALGSELKQHCEKSEFVFEDAQWFYLQGDLLPPYKLSRNELCWCGSDKKYKKCHGR